MVGRPAGGTLRPVSPLLEPECRGTQPPLEQKVHRLNVEKPEERTSRLHSYDSAEDAQRQMESDVRNQLKEIYHWS